MSTCIICGAIFQARHTYGLCKECANTDRLREFDRVESARYQVQRMNLPASLNLIEWLATLSDFEGKCAFCDEFLGNVIERFIPVHGLTYHNVIPACRACSHRRKEGYDKAEIRVGHYLQDKVTPDEHPTRQQKIEEAAQMAYEHLAYLERVGSLTREDEPIVEALRQSLKWRGDGENDTAT